MGLVGFHYTDILRESKWLKANCSVEFGPESNRRARSEATLRRLDYAIMDGWHGVELHYHCDWKNFAGGKVNRGKPEQIPLLSKAEVVYVSEG